MGASGHIGGGGNGGAMDRFEHIARCAAWGASVILAGILPPALLGVSLDPRVPPVTMAMRVVIADPVPKEGSMPSVDFDRVGRLVDVPENARKLLSRPERQQILTIALRTGPRDVLFADAFVVYYNTSRGPAKGGIRISPGVTLDETTDLAERMVWKTALVKIPFGGG